MAKQSTLTVGVQVHEGIHSHIQVVFDNGRSLAVSTANLSEEVLRAALAHGIKQKLVDAAAISRNTETGRSATTDDKFAAVSEVHARLLAGQWNKGREAGAGGKGGLLFRALCTIYKDKSAEQLRVWLDGKSDAEQAALRKMPAIANEIESIKAREAKSEGVDAGGLLDELKGM